MTRKPPAPSAANHPAEKPKRGPPPTPKAPAEVRAKPASTQPPAPTVPPPARGRETLTADDRAAVDALLQDVVTPASFAHPNPPLREGEASFPDEDALEGAPPPASSEDDSSDAFADFEDELDGDDFEGDPTQIDDELLLAEASTTVLRKGPKRPFLRVETGNDSGREFALQEGTTGLGRGVDNDIILADVSVSRRHLSIVRTDEQLQLRDLSSGNGTLLNGKRVTRAKLQHGDRLEVGETALVVCVPGSGTGLKDAIVAAAAKQSFEGAGPLIAPTLSASDTQSRPAVPSPVSRSGIVLSRASFYSSIFVAVLIIGTLGGVLAMQSRAPAPEPSVVVNAPPPGQVALAQGRWQDAMRVLCEADPGSAACDRAQRAVQAEGHLQRAQESLERGELASAQSTLEIVSGWTDLPPAQLARVRELQTLIAAASAQAALERGDLEGARGHLRRIREELGQTSSP